MLLTQDQEMIRDAVRDFAQAELWPNAAKWDKEHTFPKEAHQGLAALGAYGICVPEELGGAGLDYVTLALVLEEIAAGDGGTSTAISVTNCPVNAILMRYGNEAQKKQWLTREEFVEEWAVAQILPGHHGLSRRFAGPSARRRARAVQYPIGRLNAESTQQVGRCWRLDRSHLRAPPVAAGG